MRKPARKYPMRSEVINFRIQPATKAALQKAARASGRTVSAEAEHQLHRALSDMGSGKTHAVFAMIAKTIDGFLARASLNTGEPVEPTRRKWWDDPRLFDQVAKLSAAALELMRPAGEPLQEGRDTMMLDDGLIVNTSESHARFAIETTLREIQTADLSVPFDKARPYQRWLALLRRDLGDLADRPAIWGHPADQARELNEAAAPILAEFIPLDKKHGKAPEAMTPEEIKRHAELRRALEKVVKPKKGRKRK
jgi:hypothetical protein